MKGITYEDQIDQLERDALFREWDWLDAIAAREIAMEAVAAYRLDIPDDERMAKIKQVIEGLCEAWAEKEMEDRT